MSVKNPGRGVRVWCGAAAICLAVLPAAAGQGQPPTTAPGGSQTQPAQPGTTGTATTTPAATVMPRTFTGTAGLMFNTVRPERVADFELLLAEVQQALARSTNPATQAMAKGWRFFKAAEPGPSGVAVFVFVVDPVVPNEDYSLGRILVEAFPDAAKLQEVWKLYTTSVTGGGTLLNLTPMSPTPPTAKPVPATAPAGAAAPTDPAAPAAPGTPTPTTPAPGQSTVPRTLPPDRDPTRTPAP